MSDAPQDDRDWAALAACLLAVDPHGLGGASIRGGAGDDFAKMLRQLMPSAPHKRLPNHIAESRLLGGLDLSGTLQAGRPVFERGLLAEANDGLIFVPMAERMSARLAALMAGALDSGIVCVERDGFAAQSAASFAVIAFDESAEDENGPPAALLERLAFQLTLNARLDLSGLATETDIAAARARYARLQASDEIVTSLCNAAACLGIASLRAPMLAVRVARAHAALHEQDEVTADDAAIAARLVLAARATMIPQETEDEAEPPPPEETSHEDQQNTRQQETDRLEDVVLDAARAAIPPGLLAMLRSELMLRSTQSTSGKADAARKVALRGRPIGTRRGELRPGARLNLVETLRAAAPWQKLRKHAGSPNAVAVRRDDFRLARFKPRSETATVFVVDASGSAAMHRLAEAKGAVELLLADCYVRRDQVALIAFRGKGAELSLPPTRSLTRAKRTLAALPGGGGTPLAAAVDAAAEVADAIRRKGIAPTIVFLTDGRANVARDGAGGRERAQTEALDAARHCRASRFPAMILDISPHPAEAAQRFAHEMGARYVPLPHADAHAISRVVRAAQPAAAGA